MSYIGKTPTSVPLTSSDITDGIITTTKIADANVTNPKLTSGSQQNFRNLVINGDMGIAQRSTSAVALAHSSYHTVDRWSQNLTLASAAFTGQQVSDAPAGFENSYKISCTTADTSLAATARLFPLTRIEDRGLGFLKFGSASAQSLTLSFYVKSNKTGTYQINIWHNNPGRFTSQTYAINSANTWEHKTITFIGDQDSAMANDSGSGLQIEYVLLGGTNYTSGSVNTGAYASTAANRAAGQTVNLADSTSNSWQITGVQLEAGTTASDFELLPVDVNLERCLRYYQQAGVCTGRAYNTTAGEMYYAFLHKMRSAPSAILINGTTSGGENGGVVHISGVSSHNITALSGDKLTTVSCTFQVTCSGGGLSAGAIIGVQGNPFALSAEL